MPEKQYRKRLREIIPLDTLAPNMLDELLERAEVRSLKPKEVVFRQGDQDQRAVYLMDGSVTTHNKRRGRTQDIDASSRRASYAIGNLNPRPFNLSAGAAGATVLIVDRTWVEGLVARSQTVAQEAPSVSVKDFAQEKAIDGAWMFRMVQTPLFRDLPNTAIERLFAAIEPIELKAGDMVIEQGDQPDGYYMIASGTCEVLRDLGGMDFPIATLEPGDSFGEEGVIAGLPRAADVRMKTDGVLMRLGVEAFNDLLRAPHLQPVSATELARAIREPDVIVVDVRMESEHGARSIRGSINIPLYKLRDATERLAEARRVVTYCDTGARAEVATFLLRQRGIPCEYLQGGLASLKDKTS